MKYAVIQLGGKQVQIKEGDTFELERQSSLSFDVMLFSEDGRVEVGTPFLTDVEISAKVLEDHLGDKIRIGRFKSKSRYRRIKGHRQPMSTIQISSISKKAAKPKAETVEKAEAKKETNTTKKTSTTTKKAPAKKATSSVKKGTVKK